MTKLTMDSIEEVLQSSSHVIENMPEHFTFWRIASIYYDDRYLDGDPYSEEFQKQKTDLTRKPKPEDYYRSECSVRKSDMHGFHKFPLALDAALRNGGR